MPDVGGFSDDISMFIDSRVCAVCITNIFP